MDIQELLLLEHSKENMLRVATEIESNPELFGELMKILMSDNVRETQHAAWAMSHALELRPDLATPYIGELVAALNKPVHDAVIRAITRYLQTADLPEDLHDSIWDSCSRLLMSAQTAIAPKVFAMTILARIVELWPELSSELRFMIEEQMPFGSAGFRNRGNKVLKKLEDLSRNL